MWEINNFNQYTCFLYAIILGALMEIVYDLFKFDRTLFKRSKVVISLTDVNGGCDKTTIIDNPTSTTDYEIGSDLVKWIGYADLPQIYTIQGEDMLAFNSLAMDNSFVMLLFCLFLRLQNVQMHMTL